MILDLSLLSGMKSKITSDDHVLRLGFGAPLAEALTARVPK